MRRWVAATLLAAATLAGCSDATGSGAVDKPTSSISGSSHSSPSDPARSPSSPGPASPGPASPGEGFCPYLTADDVSAALGAPVVQTAGSMHACFFDPVGGEDAHGASVMLSRVDVQIDPADYAIQTKALCHGEVTDIDAGDDAFACVTGLGPQGQLYVGRVLVTVNVNGAVDEATGIDVATALVREVTVPPAA